MIPFLGCRAGDKQRNLCYFVAMKSVAKSPAKYLGKDSRIWALGFLGVAVLAYFLVFWHFTYPYHFFPSDDRAYVGSPESFSSHIPVPVQLLIWSQEIYKWLADLQPNTHLLLITLLCNAVTLLIVTALVYNVTRAW